MNDKFPQGGKFLRYIYSGGKAEITFELILIQNASRFKKETQGSRLIGL